MRKREKEVVYLAGKITGDPRYREKFAAAARGLEALGFTVVNPAVLPYGLKYTAYIRISTAMLDECDAICLLPCWTDSKGAKLEVERAKICGKVILTFEGLLKEGLGEGLSGALLPAT